MIKNWVWIIERKYDTWEPDFGTDNHFMSTPCSFLTREDARKVIKIMRKESSYERFRIRKYSRD